MRNKSSRLKKILFNSGAVIATICVIIAISIGFFQYVQYIEQSRVDQTVQESANLSVAIINERINSNMTYIEDVGNYLGRDDSSITSKSTLTFLQGSENTKKLFKTITTATANGDLYNPNGEIIGNISDRPYFQEAMKGKTSISNMEKSLDDNKNIITIAAPIKKHGEIVGIVNGRFLMTELEKCLSVDSFNGSGYSYIANTDGSIFVMANHPDADPKFTSIYDGFKPNPSVSDKVLNKMLSNMQSGSTGRVSYVWNNTKRTLNYTPVGVNGWYLLSVLPNDIVSSRTLEFALQTFILSAIVLFVLMVLISNIQHQRRNSQRAFEVAHKEILTIYNTIPGGVFKCLIDDNFTVTEANDGFYNFIGYSRETFEDKYDNQLLQVLSPNDICKFKSSLDSHLSSNDVISNDLRLIDCNNNEKWMQFNATAVSMPDDDDILYCCFTDISPLKQVEEKLFLSQQRYELIMDETQSVIFEWDPSSGEIIHSKTYTEKFGGSHIMENFPQCVIDTKILHPDDEPIFLGIYQRLVDGDKSSAGEIRIVQSNGYYLWCRISTAAIRDEDNILRRVIGVIEDIDSSKRELQKAKKLAERDLLTKLYNKINTQKIVEEHLNNSCGTAALLVLDIDNFKNINDSLGHDSGDKALIEFAQSLSRIFPSEIVGRIGGDEFLVYCQKYTNKEDLVNKLLDVSKVFALPSMEKYQKCSVSCSIGVAIHPDDGDDFATLFKKADSALYFSKRNGKNRFTIYSENHIDHID